MINAQILGDKISSVSIDAFFLFDKSNFGEKKENKIEYSFAETLFLVLSKKMQVYSSSKLISFEKLLSKIKKIDKKIEMKLAVYSDLRKKGYIPKAALKFGAEFRVYDKGTKPGKDHAKWILFSTKENDIIKWQDFAAKNRIAHSTRKHLLIAILDQEGDITYYQVGWIKP